MRLVAYLQDRIPAIAAHLGFKAETKATTAGPLFTAQAVDQFLSQLMSSADPDEVLRAAGISRPKLRALTGDDEITGTSDTRREALLAVPWRLEVKSEAKLKRGEFPAEVEWLWEQLEENIEKVLRSCLEALWYGYSVQEAVYKVVDGRVTWKEITEKPFEWFIPNLDASVLYKSRSNPSGEPTIPGKYFLTVRNQTYRQRYGEALFSRLYWPWFFRQQGWRFWPRYLERYGTPLLIGKTQGDAVVMAARLAKIASNAVIAVGGDDEVQIAENKSGSRDFEVFERVICARVQKLILGQTLTTDSGGSSGRSGSYALGQVHNEVRKDRRDADIRLVRPTVQRMVDWLWALNGFSGAAPRFVLAHEAGLEIERAERDVNVHKAGARLTPDYFIRVHDFEPGDLDIDAMKAANQPVGAPADPNDDPKRPPPTQKGRLAALLAAGPRFTPEQQVIERGIAEILGELGSLIPDAELKAAIRLATSPEDLEERLAQLLVDADPEQFQRVLERALFAADILGYAHAEQRAAA